MSDALDRVCNLAIQLPENIYRILKEVINVKQNYANALHYYGMVVFVCVPVKMCISSHCNKNRRCMFLKMRSIINTKDICVRFHVLNDQCRMD